MFVIRCVFYSRRERFHIGNDTGPARRTEELPQTVRPEKKISSAIQTRVSSKY